MRPILLRFRTYSWHFGCRCVASHRWGCREHGHAVFRDHRPKGLSIFRCCRRPSGTCIHRVAEIIRAPVPGALLPEFNVGPNARASAPLATSTNKGFNQDVDQWRTRSFTMNADERQEDGITTLTGDTFERMVLQGRGPIAVEFMSYSCSHCGAIEPILQQAAALLKPQETIFRVNIAVERELAQGFEILGTPTIVLFLDGTEIGRVEGPSPEISSLLAQLTQPFAH